VDRIGRFLTLMDSRLKYCRQQAEHFQKRARTAEAKGVNTKNMVLYCERYVKSMHYAVCDAKFCRGFS
jgi:hypothetical protein